MQLYEKYRPQRLSQVLGQPKAIASLRRMLDSARFDCGALWIDGPTGTGKTSIARAIARELGADDWTTTELDGDKCSVDAVRKIAETIGISGWGGSPWRVWIINEAQAMTPRAVQAWLTLLEALPTNRLVVFTSTETRSDLFGTFTQPFQDRCTSIRLTKQGLNSVFARFVHRVASREDLNGYPQERYLRLAQDCHNSCRAMLQAVDMGQMA